MWPPYIVSPEAAGRAPSSWSQRPAGRRHRTAVTPLSSHLGPEEAGPRPREAQVRRPLGRGVGRNQLRGGVAGGDSSGGTLSFYVMQKDAVGLDSSLSLVGLGRGAQEGRTGGAHRRGRGLVGLGRGARGRGWAPGGGPSCSGPRRVSSGLGTCPGGMPPFPALAVASAGGKPPVHTWVLSSLAFGKSR